MSPWRSVSVDIWALWIDNGAVTAPGVDFHSTYARKAPPSLTATTDL